MHQLKDDLSFFIQRPCMPTSLGALLAQNNDAGKEMSLYYLSCILVRVECNYPDMEKICLALVFAAQKTRPLYARTHRAPHFEGRPPLIYFK